MLNETQFQRFASPNERRVIVREDLGLYHEVVVGAIYEFPEKARIDSPSTFFDPLKQCIEAIPYLRVIVKDAHTEKPYFERVPLINLEHHISIVAQAFHEDELTAIQNELGMILDRPFSSGIPPWRIVVLPLKSFRCFVAFGYSHAIGDGITGVSFHRAFLKAVQTSFDVGESRDSIVHTPHNRLPGPLDTPERLPISWSFLLGPLIKYLMPKSLVNVLGMQSTASAVDENCWIGSLITDHRRGPRTKIRVQEVEATVLEKVLGTARRYDAKLTATIHQLVVRALSKEIQDPSITNFVVQTPLNLRSSIGMPHDESGNNGSGCYLKYPRANPSVLFSEENWNTARSATRTLAECAARLQDQPIALLRYVKSIRGWTLGRLGQDRDSSFEVSNVGFFDPSPNEIVDGDPGTQTKLVEMVFAHPGHVTGAAICFSLASVKGAKLFCTVTWQTGGLGVPENEEDEFIDKVCRSIVVDLENM